MINGLINKIKNAVRFASVSNNNSDNLQFPNSQVKYSDNVKNYICLYPYGYSANAPVDTLAVLINVGHTDNTVALMASGDERIKNKKPGEVALGNGVIKTHIYFKENGDVEIESKNKVIINSASGVDVIGNVSIIGDVVATGSISGASVLAGSVNLGTHIHSGVTTGAGVSGPPV